MKSTGLDNSSKSGPSIVERDRNSPMRDNDLLIGGNSGDNALPSKEKKIDPVQLKKSGPITVNDVINFNREGIDETEQIRRLETRNVNPEGLNGSLLPRMPTSFIDNLVESANDEKELDTDDCRHPGLQGNSSNLSELTRRYARFSASEKDPHAGQDIHLPEGDRRNPEFQASGTTRSSTLSELTTQYARLSISQQNPDASSNFFPSTSLMMDDSVARGVADLYYKNAEKIINQDIEAGQNGSADSTGDSSNRSRKQKCLDVLKLKRRIAAVLEVFQEFAQPHKKRLRLSFKRIAIYVMLPSLIMAILLFYGFGNPPNGYALILCDDLNSANNLQPQNRQLQSIEQVKHDVLNPFPKRNSTSVPTAQPSPSPTLAPTPVPKPTYQLSDRKTSDLCINKESSKEEASISWWFLFIGVRQAITFCLAVLMETIVIDFLMFRTRFFPKLIGTELALLVGQSKGWPCTLFFWAMFDILLLFGKAPHARHWFFYQNFISLMNATNPSGGIPEHEMYKRIIYFAIGLSVAATLKRTFMANFVGQRVVVNYRYSLTDLIKKLLIVGDLANLAKVASDRKRGTKSILFQRVASLGRDVIGNLEDSENDEEDNNEVNSTAGDFVRRKIDTSPSKYSGNSIFTSLVYDYLDEWEEPELETKSQNVSTKDVLNVRRAVEFISSDYPFSPSFGSATTRSECARASQNLFEMLLKSDENVLNFEVLCNVARNADGTNNRKKILDLVKLFRPNRNGEITKLDFVKSIDSVYKRLRLLLANIKNSSQIDRAYGQITNIIFWAVAILVGLSVFGYQVEALLITTAGLLVSFSFMISAASSKYVEGILLILVRRPYDIGDKVCFMEPNADVDDFGPPGGGWIVETVDLYTTTVRKGTTREWATFTNGSLANSRILNLKKSEKPNIYMYLKFTMNITQEQLDEFRRRIIEFIKDRPREWIKLVSLRCTHFETEQQYLKFSLIVQHRESWQSFGTIQVSKSDIYIHALHLQKELKMDYNAPKVPVHLSGIIPKTLTNGFLDRDVDGMMKSANEPLPQFSPTNSALEDKSEPRESGDLSCDTKQNEFRRVSSPSSSAGERKAVEGSLIRRKGNRSANFEPLESFQESVDEQPMNNCKGSTITDNTTIRGPQDVVSRQVSFATEVNNEGKKNKDM